MSGMGGLIDVSGVTTATSLALSMHGVETWRLYRSGANPGLLLDLYGDPDRHYDAKIRRVCHMLSLYRGSAAFTGMPGMVDLVRNHVLTLDPELQTLFVQQWYVLHREVAEVFLPNYAVDDYFYDSEFAWVKRFITCVLGVADLPAGLREAVAPLWFEMCDTALMVMTRTKGR